jgi:hypothetical protein
LALAPILGTLVLCKPRLVETWPRFIRYLRAVANETRMCKTGYSSGPCHSATRNTHFLPFAETLNSSHDSLETVPAMNRHCDVYPNLLLLWYSRGCFSTSRVPECRASYIHSQDSAFRAPIELVEISSGESFFQVAFYGEWFKSAVTSRLLHHQRAFTVREYRTVCVSISGTLTRPLYSTLEWPPDSPTKGCFSKSRT